MCVRVRVRVCVCVVRACGACVIGYVAVYVRAIFRNDTKNRTTYYVLRIGGIG